MADGKVSVPYSTFIGDDKGEDGNLAVNTEQAKTIKLIFGDFIAGLSFHAIAEKLTGLGIKTPRGGARWHQGTVKSILMNEKYKGDALVQKYYTPDFLTKKQVRNSGEIPQYYVEGSHECCPYVNTFEPPQKARKLGISCDFGVAHPS